MSAVQCLTKYLTGFERQDLPGCYFTFGSGVEISSFPGILASHDEIAKPRYFDRIPFGKLLLHDLEDGFDD